MRIVVVDEKHYRQIRGVVRIQSDPDPIKEKEALVEIFTRPENLLQDRSTGSKVKSKQRRIAACRTGIDGKFCFRNVGPGKYELRSSIGFGINVTSVCVIVDPAEGTQEEINVDMVLGT